MTIGNDDAIRAFLADEARRAVAAAPSLDAAVGRLAPRVEGRPSRTSQRLLVLLAATLLLMAALGTAIAIGSGVLRLPLINEDLTLPRLAYEIDGDIYLADWDGENAVRVADGSAVAGDPQCQGLGGEGSIWAPDGRHFAFRSTWTDECPGEVHVLDADGRLVATVPGSGWDVSWSPDSSRFATWVDFFQTIGIYGIDGERQALLMVDGEAPLTADSGCRPDDADLDPVWSPDGGSVLVRPCEVPIDGGTPRPLSRTDPRVGISSTLNEVAFSPDGTRIARVTREGDAGTDLAITEADGTVLQQVVPEDSPDAAVIIHNPVWSPTGDRVLFIHTSAELSESPATSEIREVDIRTGQEATLAMAPEIWLIGFSPEGDRILFATRDNQTDTRGLWSMDADGSHQQLLVPGTIWGEWQPLTGVN